MRILNALTFKVWLICFAHPFNSRRIVVATRFAMYKKDSTTSELPAGRSSRGNNKPSAAAVSKRRSSSDKEKKLASTVNPIIAIGAEMSPINTDTDMNHLNVVGAGSIDDHVREGERGGVCKPSKESLSQYQLRRHAARSMAQKTSFSSSIGSVSSQRLSFKRFKKSFRLKRHGGRGIVGSLLSYSVEY